MAKTETKEDKKRGGSLIMQLAVLVLMSALAGGAGWGMSGFMSAPPAPEGEEATAPAVGQEAAKHAAPAPEGAHGAPTGDGHGESSPKDGEPASLMGNALLLEPIVTNIASPQDVWVRLELALVAGAPLDGELAQAIREDLFAYVRTVRLSQLEGPSGFISLKADLLDRAKIRSEDKVNAVLIKTLLFE
jgi:flagellar protein FliL